MVDLEQLERSIVEQYRDATAPPEAVANLMLDALVTAATPAATAATATTATTAVTTGSAKTIVGVALAVTMGGVGAWVALRPPTQDPIPPSSDERSEPTTQIRAAAEDTARPVLSEVKPPSTPASEPEEASPAETTARRRESAAALGPPRDPTAESKPAPVVQRPSARETLAGETTLVKRVDQAVRGGRLDAATKMIADYRAKFPDGVLTTEIDALELIVACQRPDPSTRQRAQRFVESHSGGLSERVRETCDNEGETQ